MAKKKKTDVSSLAEFQKFLTKNPTLSRTGAYNEFRKQGGKIRKQTALEIARAVLDIKRGEKQFIGKKINTIKKTTSKEVKEGKREKIELFIPKQSKPKKNQSNIIGPDGNFISKSKATELRRLQRSLREEKGLRISLKELAQTGNTTIDVTEEQYIFAHSSRNLLSTIAPRGVQTITIIDRNGKKETYTGTYEQLQSNPSFMRKLEDEQQRLFQAAGDSLLKRGMEKDYKDKSSDGYKIFQMQVKVTEYNNNLTVFDYRDIKEELSGVGAEEIIKNRKLIRKQG